MLVDLHTINSMKDRYNIVDIFCGTGSFAQGFLDRDDSFNLLCSVDILKNATETVKLNHPESLILNTDIRKVDLEELSDDFNCEQVDVIIGGPPCQGFSSLRPNRSSGNEDDRNNLFLEFARFVEFFSPKVFVLENVVGILTHNDGDTLNKVLEAFDRIGYKTDWRILNAANYGVPQKRERFILIGTRENTDIKFPAPTHYFDGSVIGYRDNTRMVKSSEGLKPAITVMDAISDLPEIERAEKSNKYACSPKNEYQKSRRNGCEELTLHEASNHSDKMLEIIKHAGDNISSIPSHLITSGFSSSYSRIRPNEPSNTITVKFRSPSSSKCIHPYQDRSITIREAARIQGFKDTFLFAGSNTDISSLIGNAVPAPLGYAIAESALHILESEIEVESKMVSNG